MTEEGTTPERMSGFFKYHTEGHFTAICAFAGRGKPLTQDEFRDNIGAARDVKIEPGFRLTPITDKTGVRGPGWWTCRPTEHIMGWADHAELQRQLAAWRRNLRVQSGTKFVQQLEAMERRLRLEIADMLEQHFAELMISPESDYVITAVNEAIEEERVSVVRA